MIQLEVLTDIGEKLEVLRASCAAATKLGSAEI